MKAVVLDSGALSAWATGDRQVTTLLAEILRHRGAVVVPTVVLAESLTGNGSRDAAVHVRLRRVQLDACERQTAVHAAALRSKAGGRGLAIDAIVVATADKYRAALLTGDVDDLRRLANAGDCRIAVLGVRRGSRSRPSPQRR